MNDQLYIDAAMDDIERALGPSATQVSASVIETKFRWLRSGRVVWARSLEWKQALFWVSPPRPPAHLDGPNGLAHVSDMITSSTGPLPHGLSPLLLAEAIRQLSHDPRGVVTTRAYLAALGPRVARWLKGDSDAHIRLFEEQWIDPSLDVAPGGDWSLDFRCFNVAGAVEQWRATGDARRIVSARGVTRVAPGTFRWPMA